MMISSVSRLCSLCMPTGMPRPLSSTVTELSAWIVTATWSAVADLRLVDRVVDELEDHVVEAREVVGVADVHAGALADGLEPLEELDRVGGVGVLLIGLPFGPRPRAVRGGRPTAPLPDLEHGRRAARPRANRRRRAVVRSTVAPSGQRVEELLHRALRKPGVEVVGAEQRRLARGPGRAVHSASLTSATVRCDLARRGLRLPAAGPAPARAGRRGAARRANTRAGARADRSLWQSARRALGRLVGRGNSTRIAAYSAPAVPGELPEMPPHDRQRGLRWRRTTASPASAQLLGPGLDLPSPPPRGPPRALAQQSVALLQGRRVARQVVARGGLEPEDQPVEEPAAHRGGRRSGAPCARAPRKTAGAAEDTSRNPAGLPPHWKRRPSSLDHETSRRFDPPRPWMRAATVKRAWSRAMSDSAAPRNERCPHTSAAASRRLVLPCAFSPVIRVTPSPRETGSGERLRKPWLEISESNKRYCPTSKVRVASA